MDPYEWDETKYATNLLKHRIRFELVRDFDWSAAKYEVDERYEYGEERVRAFGRTEGRPYCVVFTPRGQKLRIISMRPMHEREARKYGI
ncbi:MAG TPA: BrnT family toxin [Devosia sp.]|jgi:uncharacterized DUF497 family protein|nr:BrnT family toxin [Devosia sp.]